MNDTDQARREKDRARKAAERLRKGMVPQSKRNVSKLMGEIAHDSGVHVSTLYRHQKAGTLDSFLFDPESLRKKFPTPTPDDADRTFASMDAEAANPSADTSFASSGISEVCREDHSRTVAKLLSEAEAAQAEWLDTMPPWSMM
ncbi:hypothetical protein GU700_21615 [Methylobacterium sp. NI91]|nr:MULTISPECIES: hypothetical protein [unclassified Methylobacterium]QIJ76947.1 hypothetical protein CLZ_21610 [Methylobacterium sp. CLZ]QIJ81851.1 hypothetical protein GU700_21615 [Methylobacterium sp. NI91]